MPLFLLISLMSASPGYYVVWKRDYYFYGCLIQGCGLYESGMIAPMPLDMGRKINLCTVGDDGEDDDLYTGIFQSTYL